MSDMPEKFTGPHQGQPVLAAGEPIEQARAAMIMVHGRGASAEDILGVADSFRQSGFVYLAPQAAGYSWYPNSFLAPIARNEPGLSSGLAVIASLLDQLEGHNIPAERTIILGSSRGPGWWLEFLHPHPS